MLVARFPGALSWEDAEDVVQQALAEKAPRDDDGRTTEQRHAWWATVLRNAAIDFIRARDGRATEATPARGRAASLEGLEAVGGGLDVALADQDVEVGADELDREYERVQAQRVARRALRRLDRRDRRLIEGRYMHRLTNAELAAEVEMTVSGIEKAWPRAWVRFVSAVVTDDAAEAICGDMRLLMGAREIGAVATSDVARFEAHMAECVACRAWELTGRRAAAALPVLPSLGLLEVLTGKLGMLVERLPFVGEQAGGHAATAGATTGAGAGGAGLLAALGGNSLAACSAAVAVCAGGGAAIAIPAIVDHDRPVPEQREARLPERPSEVASAASTRPVVAPAPRAEQAVAQQAAREVQSTRASVQPTQEREPRQRVESSRRVAGGESPGSGAPFLPESAAEPDLAAARATPTVTPAPPRASASSKAAGDTTAPSPSSASSAPSSSPTTRPENASAFTGEFTP